MPPLYLRVFERLIIEANHQDNEIPYKKRGEKITGKKLIKRGERLTSVRDICKWVMWYERGKEVIPNPKTMQNILDWLAENNMIKIYSAKGNRTETHYKIVNYNDYQKKEDEEVTEKKQFGNTLETESKQSGNTLETESKQSGNSLETESKQSLDTNKNVKNDNNIYTFEKTSDEKTDTDNTDIPRSENNSKAKKVFSNDDKEYKLANYLSKQIAKRLEKPEKDEKTLQSWSAEFNKMIRLDKLDVDEMKDVLVFCQNHKFWKNNILSVSKFRKQYLTLLSTMKGDESLV